MSELKCTHSCSDCSRLGCRSASEEQYPPFCLTTNVDKALLEETLEIYRNDPEQGLIARTSACIEGEFYGRLTVSRKPSSSSSAWVIKRSASRPASV